MKTYLAILAGSLLCGGCATTFPGEPHSAVSEYLGGQKHQHGAEMVHAHAVNAADPAHFHPKRNWDETRTVTEEKKRRLKKERDRRRMSMITRPAL